MQNLQEVSRERQRRHAYAVEGVRLLSSSESRELLTLARRPPLLPCRRVSWVLLPICFLAAVLNYLDRYACRSCLHVPTGPA